MSGGDQRSLLLLVGEDEVDGKGPEIQDQPDDPAQTEHKREDPVGKAAHGIRGTCGDGGQIVEDLELQVDEVLDQIGDRGDKQKH